MELNEVEGSEGEEKHDEKQKTEQPEGYLVVPRHLRSPDAYCRFVEVDFLASFGENDFLGRLAASEG